jgi:hypothetical protein
MNKAKSIQCHVCNHCWFSSTFSELTK